MSLRRALAVVAAFVLSTIWTAASAIAVLLGVAHVIAPVAPPPRRLVRSIRRARPRPPSREPTLVISPTLTDEPEELPSIAIQRPSVDIAHSPPPPGRFARSLKRMMSLDPSLPSESAPELSRGRSPSLSPVLQRSPSNSPARPVKDRHAISAEVARAAWVAARA
ncbi:hypothetical protein AURDEDRAFT_114804 [Auricularia subglabra TFB-10046 SS5]|nr:hypothetical protein AURDEDRAFT_114804 [Auricularia subglabra TFB-10046 SS5]